MFTYTILAKPVIFQNMWFLAFSCSVFSHFSEIAYFTLDKYMVAISAVEPIGGDGAMGRWGVAP